MRNTDAVWFSAYLLLHDWAIPLPYLLVVKNGRMFDFDQIWEIRR
jgi:hypothetical protein